MPTGKKFKPNKSKERMMFVLAKAGKMPMTEAVGKAKATKKKWPKLPEKKAAKKRGK